MAFAVPEYIWDRAYKRRGETTGGRFRCKLEGCTGMRIATRWPDGKITFPCSKGLKYLKPNEAKIE